MADMPSGLLSVKQLVESFLTDPFQHFRLLDCFRAKWLGSQVMPELAELHRFNAWANRNVLSGVRQLAPEQLTERREGMYGTVLSVLSHLAGVESSYLSANAVRAVRGR